MSGAWQRHHPTEAQALVHRWWWCRSPNFTACVIRFGVSGGFVHAVSDNGDPIGYMVDEDTEWAPCLEPPNERVLAIAEMLASKNVTPEAIAGYEMIQGAIKALMVAADHAEAKNYIEITMVGLLPPFDRAAIQLVRPGGKTPMELQRAAEGERDAIKLELEECQAELDAQAELAALRGSRP